MFRPVPPNLFQLFCHDNSRCTLKIGEEGGAREFDTVTDAMRAALQLARGDKSMLKVYSTLGSVVFEASI